MSSAVHEYKKYIKLIRSYHKLFVIVTLTITTLVGLTSYLLPRKFEANSVVFIEKNIINKLVEGVAATISIEDSVKVLTYSLNSRSLMLKVINELDVNLKSKSDADIEKMIKDFQSNTAISVKDRDLFTISFKHSDPKFARDYVNTLVRSYIAQYATSRRDQSLEASQFLTDQVENFKRKMEKSEAAVTQFKMERGGVFNYDETSLLQEINSARQKLYELQLRRKVLEGQLAVARKGGDPQQVKLDALKKRLAELQAEYTENYPEVQSIKSQIETLKNELGTSPKNARPSQLVVSEEYVKLDSELKALKDSEQQLNGFIAYNQKLLNSVPASRAMLEKLESEKENQKRMYDTLFSRHDQSVVAKDMQMQDRTAIFRIVDPAVTPIRPSSPNRVKIMFMGFVAALAVAAGLVMFIDLFDQSIKTTADLNSFGLPVLAVIPTHRTVVETLRKQLQTRNFYLLCGAYSAVLVVFFVMEVLKFELMDRFLNVIGLPAFVQGFFR